MMREGVALRLRTVGVLIAIVPLFGHGVSLPLSLALLGPVCPPLLLVLHSQLLDLDLLYGPRTLGVKQGRPAWPLWEDTWGTPGGAGALWEDEAQAQGPGRPASLQRHRRSRSGLRPEATSTERFSLTLVTKIAPPWSRSVTSPCLGPSRES